MYIYIFTKTPSPKKQKKKKNKKKKQYTHCHYGIQRNFRSKPGKKNTRLFKTHIHTNIILPLYLFQYCKLILRQSALNSFLVSAFPDFCWVSSLTICVAFVHSWNFLLWDRFLSSWMEFDIYLYIGLCLYMYICIHIYTHRHTDIVLGTPKPKLSIVSFVLIYIVLLKCQISSLR